MCKPTCIYFVVLMAVVLLVNLSGVAQAVDGVVLIDQNRALAGNVTPGDAPGFPVTISRPGSYRLSGNLTVPDIDTNAIEVLADNVALDLNGFSIIGPAVCSTDPASPAVCEGSGKGIGVFYVFAGEINHKGNLTVSNGTITGMGDGGIAAGVNSYIEKVRAIGNRRVGIAVNSGVVINNIASGNGVVGILVEDGVVTGNAANRNGSWGIFAVHGNMVFGNVASTNGDVGLALGDSTGYSNNVLRDNRGGAQVRQGRQMGGNVCGNALCP